MKFVLSVKRTDLIASIQSEPIVMLESDLLNPLSASPYKVTLSISNACGPYIYILRILNAHANTLTTQI
jgi:hypothetical protein